VNATPCSFCGMIDGGRILHSVTREAFICYRCVEKAVSLLSIDRSLVRGARPLSRRQSEIYDYLTVFNEQHGYMPSFDEIALHFGYASLATVHEHLRTLEVKGWIERDYNCARAIRCLVQRPRAAA
jgi:hypothetical protein